MTVTSMTYFSAGNGAIADQSIKLLNGIGQVRQEQARGPDNGQNQTWDAVDTIYNNLGQVYQQSQPYRIGAGSPVLKVSKRGVRLEILTFGESVTRLIN